MVKYMTSQCCDLAVFFDLSQDIANDNYDFDFFYSMTPKAALLDAGDIVSLTWSNCVIYTAMNITMYQYPYLPITMLSLIGCYYVAANYKEGRNFYINPKLHIPQQIKWTEKWIS